MHKEQLRRELNKHSGRMAGPLNSLLDKATPAEIQALSLVIQRMKNDAERSGENRGRRKALSGRYH